MMAVSEIEYLYRDSGNYKFRGVFKVSCIVTINEITPYLIDGEYFVPNSIGVASLTPLCLTEDDHSLHEIEGIRHAEIGESDMTRDEFFNRLAYASRRGWFND